MNSSSPSPSPSRSPAGPRLPALVTAAFLIVSAGCGGPAPKPDKPVADNTEPKTAKSTEDGFKTRKPVVCSGSQKIRLEKVRIKAPRVAVSATGSCRVTIIDSEISAGGVAIFIEDGKDVAIDIRNSVIKGAEAAFFIDGAGDITAKDTKFIGGRLAGDGTFRDGGGNTWE